MRYEYEIFGVYDSAGHAVKIMDVAADCPARAISKAGFDGLIESGGAARYTRKGAGYTNTAIYIYEPVAAALGCKRPDFIMRRKFR